MNLKNYTSTVTPAKSLADIEEMLVEAGASDIRKSYVDKVATSISFLMLHKGETLAFRMTANVDAVFKILYAQVKRPQPDTRKRVTAQAQRTAWKNIHDLVAAQVAILLTEQASAVELFLPYLLDEKFEKTLAERAEGMGENVQKLLQ